MTTMRLNLSKPNFKTIIFSWSIIFIIKFIFAYSYTQISESEYPGSKLGMISVTSGDYQSYLGAMENYVQSGNYFFRNENGDTVRAGRMPYYAFPYWVARHFLKPGASIDVLTIINIILDVTAIICLALMAYSLAGYKLFAYYSGLLLGSISLYVSYWSIYTLTDASAASAFMIGIYCFWRSFISPKNNLKMLMVTSIFFSWTILLRPYFVIIIGVFALYYLFKKKVLFSEMFKLAAVCLIPFVLLITPWIVRNYLLFNRIIPFQQDVYAGYNYSQSELESRKLASALGEDGATFWDNGSMASFFYPKTFKTSNFKYPRYLAGDTALFNELENIRHDYIGNYNNRSGIEEKSLVSRMEKLRILYKKKYTFRFFGVNNIKKIKAFWMHSGSYYLAVSNDNRLGKFLTWGNKLLQSLLYYLVLFLGTIGLWRLRKYDNTGYILLVPVVILTVIFPLTLGLLESRFSIPFYYPCLIGLCLFIYTLTKRLFPQKMRNF